MILKIYKNISKYNHYKYSTRTIKFIVIHYVGKTVSTAKDNATYFANGDRQASAHYFVDKTSIWQSVLDKNAAWHCGGGLQGSGGHKYYKICTNANSIGIEMCVNKKDGEYYIDEDTIKNTAWLVKKLMKQYDIPAKRVIRHYDVTGKECPIMYVNETKWEKLHKTLTGSTTTKKKYSGTFPTLPAKGYLGRGDKGKQVGYLQGFLKWYGYSLEKDESFGGDTESKVKKYQEKEGLEIDGMFGKESLDRAKEIKK